MRKTGFFLAIFVLLSFFNISSVVAETPEVKPFLRVVFDFSINNGAGDNIRLFAIVDPYTLGSYEQRKEIVCGRKKIDNYNYTVFIWLDSSIGDTFAFTAGQLADKGFTALLMGGAKLRSDDFSMSSFAYTSAPVELRANSYSDKARFDFMERLKKEDQKRGKKIEQLECKIISEK